MGQRIVVVLACVVIFVVILDATIVSVALPELDRELGLGAGGLAWVVNAYTVVFAGFLMLGGRCSDVLGLRATMLAGLGLFGAGSLAAGVAGTAAELLSARAGQGLGGALLMPTALAAITTAVPEGPRRATALATWSTVGAVGGAAGTVVGGVLTQTVGWRWVFLVNLPVVAVAVVLAARGLPAGASRSARQRLDLPGAVLVTVGLTALVFAVIQSEQDGWARPWIWGGVAGGVLVIGLFLWWEHRLAAQPLLPLSLFRSPAVRGANLTMFVLGLAFFAAPVLVSLYVQRVHGYSPMSAGLAFVPAGLGMITGGRVAGRLTVRLGARRAAVAGIGTVAAGFVLLAASTSAHAGYVLGIAVPGFLFGLGFAAAATPLTVVGTRQVPVGRNGVAAGLFNTTRQTSGAIGLAVLSAVSAVDSTAPAVMAKGYGLAFAVTAALAVAAVALAVVIMPRDHAGGSAAEAGHEPAQGGVDAGAVAGRETQ